MLYKIEAVQCRECEKVFSLDSPDYVTFFGKVETVGSSLEILEKDNPVFCKPCFTKTLTKVTGAKFSVYRN
jgi:hypothetical protein